MAIERLGVTIPLATPLAEHGKVFAALTAAGYDELWTAETAGADAFSPLLLASQCTSARLGTAIASVFARGPALLAMQAAALADAAPGRVAIGIGASSPTLVEGWHDRSYERPLARVADTLRVLRASLAGERVSATFETFTLRGLTLDRSPAVPPALLVAALKPRMLALAGDLADGAILNWLSADDVPTVAPLVHAGGAGKEIVARIFVVPCADVDEVRSATRPLLARYLSVPAYAAYHGWLGRSAALEPMLAAARRKEPAEASAAVPDELVDALVVHGSPYECALGIARYVEAGVTTPVVKILSIVAGRNELADAVAVGQAVRKLHPLM